MSKRIMDNAVVEQIRAAHEAATWCERLEDGLSEVERGRYMRWLRTSPGNVEAMLFLMQLVGFLRGNDKAITCH